MKRLIKQIFTLLLVLCVVSCRTKDPELAKAEKLMPCFFSNPPLYYKDQTKVLLAQYQEKIPEATFQTWVNDTLSSYQDADVVYQKSSFRLYDVPAFLIGIEPYPPAISIIANQYGQRYIKIYWGGTRAFYGIAASSNAFEFPQEHWYAIRWNETIYVWHSNK